MSAVKLEDARRIISAAEKKANEIGQPMNIAVADEGGNIVAHARMDGAWIGSIDISMKKAYTSRAFDIATKDLSTHSQSGGQFFGIHASNDGKIMIFAGGIPLKREGKVVGAIGVSGGSGDQDHAVAEAGAKAFYGQQSSAFFARQSELNKERTVGALSLPFLQGRGLRVKSHSFSRSTMQRWIGIKTPALAKTARTGHPLFRTRRKTDGEGCGT